jgi:FAD/FMN-containing dehydrogenase
MTNISKILSDKLGCSTVITGDDIDARFMSDWSGVNPQCPLAVLRPGTVEDVSFILKTCYEHGQAVVPQGGLTGLVSGATPLENSIVINLERLNTIEEVDPQAATMTVQAGVVLGDIQRKAEDAGYFFPLDLGARDSSQIGGNISTNAGGNRVVKYGMTRSQVLGLEVVLADGTVISALNKMMKNNTGYDLKQLFIGAEGTLGVITRAVLKLSPQARSCSTALCALPDFASAVSLLREGNACLPGGISAFELMWSSFYKTMTSKVEHIEAPLEADYPLYVLLECMGNNPVSDPVEFESFLEKKLIDGTIVDAVIAKSQDEVNRIWEVRDSVAEFPRLFPDYIGFDISVPIGMIGAFVDACELELNKQWPKATWLFFGHVGDSNLHLIIGADMYGETARNQINEIVYTEVSRNKGSISAEHGIGLQKKAYLHHSLSEEQLELMRVIKFALDPKGILNPGKIFDPLT